MMRPTSRLALALAMALTPGLAGTAAPAAGQDGARAVDGLFDWVEPGMPGCAIGVARDGEPVVRRGYGLANLETGAPIGPATQFDIGSVQKQFVAAAVLLLAEEGRLALSDDVREHVPELSFTGHRVTVDQLLTHTSGIRDWVALMNFAADETDALSLIVRQRGLNFEPGTEWSYSNSNYVLAKEIVARVSGMPFAEFARRRLFEPLGMAGTLYAADIRAADNGALAYERRGDQWAPAMMLGDERGGGAVLSTVSDLLLWNDALTEGRLGDFVTGKLQEPARLSNGRELSYARGLFVEDTPHGIGVWHTGSARAYGALLSRLPEQGLSIALLCNAGEVGERGLAGRRVADLFLPPAPEAAEGRSAPAPGLDVDVRGRAGLFFPEGAGEPLRLVASRGRLQVAGGPPLVAVAEDRFRVADRSPNFMSEAEIEIRYQSDDVFELRTGEGESTRYRRARPYAPAAAELQALAGRYESDELGARLDITPADGAMVIRLNGAQSIPFEPVHPDTFQRGPLTVRFIRDAGSTVLGLEFSTPALRGVRFERR